jgi:hypothetical protein
VLKRFFLIIALSVTVSTVKGTVSPNDVSTRIVFRDSNTPLELMDPCIPHVYHPIIIGTELSIIVSSNADGSWNPGGGLFIVDPYRDYGILDNGRSLPAAGTSSIVSPWEDDSISGFDMFTDFDAIIGDWFIIDYNAIKIGDCNVGLYDYSISTNVPLYNMTVTSILTPDFNNIDIVNFIDFAVLSSNWQRTDCSNPGYCEGADLNGDGIVDFRDIKLFAYFWLENPE